MDARRPGSRAILPVFYRNVLAAIRAVDPSALVFVEPRVDWTVYGPHSIHVIPDARMPQTQLGISENDDHGLIFAFHHYDPWTIGLDATVGAGDSMANKEREWPAAFAAMVSAASGRGLVPFVTEHGADNHWSRHSSDIDRPSYRNDEARAYIDFQLRQLERYLLGSTYWNFDLYSSAEEGDHWNDEDFSMLGPDRRVRNEDLAVPPFPPPLRGAPGPALLRCGHEALCPRARRRAPGRAHHRLRPAGPPLPGRIRRASDRHRTRVGFVGPNAHVASRTGRDESRPVFTSRGAASPPPWPNGYVEFASSPATPRLARSFP